MTGAGWYSHKIIEITDAGKGSTSSLPLIYNVKKELFFANGECFVIDKHLLMGDYVREKGAVCNIVKLVLTLLAVMVGATGFEPATS